MKTVQFPGQLLALAALLAIVAAAQSDEERQIIVCVAARDLGNRPRDQVPAEFHLAAADFASNRRLDPAAFKVVRWDSNAGKESSTPLPCRWYDDAIPYDFPECEQNLHATDGVMLRYISRPRWGDYYDLLPEGRSGRLVWLHTQVGSQPSEYAMSLRLLPEGRVPDRVGPRGFVGDGSHRCLPEGHTTTGMIHSRVTVTDWDADGLPDLLVGGARGHVLFYRNVGTRTKPDFRHARLVSAADGRPIDVGFSASPLAVDWDGDGLTDLLCGCERNRILFFRNTGTKAAARLINQGFLTVDTKPLALPVEPVPKAPREVFNLDYYPVLDAVDWTGDGRNDLLAGGFITGRVYLYENLGESAGQAPRLAFRGPLAADGLPLNVKDWAAAPCAADFDGDGDLDLITGSMPMTAGGGDSSDPDHFLRYFENVGTRNAPRLTERPFPKTGRFPNSPLATPRCVDLNGDGVLDLAVSAGANIYLFMDEGTRTRPRFAVHDRPLPGVWSSAPLPTFGIQFLDWNTDGLMDMLTGLNIYIQSRDGEYRPKALLLPGTSIDHPAPTGDGWTFTQLADLDGDGRLDLLFGSHEGHVWLHRNQGQGPGRFDLRGVQLKTRDGRPIKVGPVRGQKMDFDVLQGARTTFAVADFDGDGLLDLVAGDTYGIVRYFRNIGTRKEPVFSPAVQIGDQKIRMVPAAADWDGDGRIDVVGSAANGTVEFFRNLGGNRFAAPVSIAMPAVPYSPAVAVADWNRDGDADLIVGTSYGYFCWFERSFLDRGYSRAEPVK